VQGDLTLQFVGDPSFTIAKLQQLIEKTRQAGVQNINGNVIIDGTAFAKPWYGPGWSQDDLNWYFAAPISAMILNENCFGINLQPNATLQQPASLTFAVGPLQKYLTLQHAVTTVTFESAKDLCALNADVNDMNHVSLDGCWPSGSAEKLKFAVKNPERLMQQVVNDLLQAEGIQVSGQVIVGKKPKEWQVIAEQKSAPLQDLIRTVLKDSNNVYAECITKTLGAKLYNVGSFLTGSMAIKTILHKHTDINFNQSVLVDGSGLSRYDLLTPRQIVRLLFVMSNEPKFSSLYQQALPESGEDGSLKNRMQSIDLRGHIHAKTGSFKGVASLSGYLTSVHNKPLIFSVMINHVVDDSKDAQLLQSQILQVLYQL
nr:D-alanyl-D-alanine carboxypeptidase/D-alanyl-D-alanine-endopeptidase [Pseudomonadota bacterium]